MNQAEKAELLEQIEKWNDADEFARCIEAIEAIPEQERDHPGTGAGLSADAKTGPSLQQSGGAG